MKSVTVEQLRASGNKVRVKHQRYFLDVVNKDGRIYFSGAVLGPLTRGEFENLKSGILSGDKIDADYQDSVSPTGGQTVVQITTKDGRELEGVADCSMHDPYNRKKGLAIALGRALAAGR